MTEWITAFFTSWVAMAYAAACVGALALLTVVVRKAGSWLVARKPTGSFVVILVLFGVALVCAYASWENVVFQKILGAEKTPVVN